MNNYVLQGLRIQVVHEKLGVLFACVIYSEGTLLDTNEDGLISELSWRDINRELEKFGFLVYYHPKHELPADQLAFLIQIHNLGMDKLRLVGVRETYEGLEQIHTKVVAFQADAHPKWLDVKYHASLKEFNKALTDGTAMNIGTLSKEKGFSWTWLDYVATIADILEENGEVFVCPRI